MIAAKFDLFTNKKNKLVTEVHLREYLFRTRFQMMYKIKYCKIKHKSLQKETARKYNQGHC